MSAALLLWRLFAEAKNPESQYLCAFQGIHAAVTGRYDT